MNGSNSSPVGGQSQPAIGTPGSAGYRPPSITAAPVEMPSATDGVMSSLGGIMGKAGGGMSNAPTPSAPQFNFASTAPTTMRPTNYLLSQMNLPNVSPLSRKLQIPFLQQ